MVSLQLRKHEKAQSRQETGKARGHNETRVGAVCDNSEWFAARREAFMENDTSKLDPCGTEEQFCVNGGQERGLAGEGLSNHLYLMLPIQKHIPEKMRKKNVFEYLREKVRRKLGNL